MSAFQDYREGVTKGEKAKRAMRIAFCGYVLAGLANAFVTAFADAARDEFVGHSLGALGNAYTDLSDEYLLKEGSKFKY